MNVIAEIQRVREQYSTLEIVKRAIPHTYNKYIRPILPRVGPAPRWNGVKVANHRGQNRRQPRLFDDIVPWETPSTDDNLTYEEALIDALRERVQEGDDVVVVGGGNGISTVVAAEATGPNGQLTVYEAGSHRVKRIENTVRLNDVEDQCQIHCAIVGTGIHVHGLQSEQGETIDSTEIPRCDVLELDCEGAEFDILPDLQIRPRVIIVETHPRYPDGERKIKEILRELGYEILDKRTEDEDNDIHVLTAVHSAANSDVV